jgi:hypothetical protein
MLGAKGRPVWIHGLLLSELKNSLNQLELANNLLKAWLKKLTQLSALSSGTRSLVCPERQQDDAG